AQGIITPILKSGRSHIYHVYGIRIENRDWICEQLREKGISVLIHYPIPLHLQNAYSELGYKKGDFPIAEKVATQIMSIPMSPHLSEEKIRFVAATLKELNDGK
ncbi:MAG: DegT/DnrJ/EryC1/StrS family aminotransferase, partial [Candidatus Omnitrophota bacterium]|nr:DegT/DnrJ/EryC1/StrS family aminotransferase [Candidatus Omnitrophota bacterium]